MRMLNLQLCKTPVGVVQLFSRKSETAAKVNQRGDRYLARNDRLALHNKCAAL
jgi:hypothetical protein